MVQVLAVEEHGLTVQHQPVDAVCASRPVSCGRRWLHRVADGVRRDEPRLNAVTR